MIQQVKNTGLRGYLCYFDLDLFKQINDELGGAKGDEALVEFSTVLRATFCDGTLLVRLGGDEFLEASAGVTYFDKTGPHSIDVLATAADGELYKNKESRRHAHVRLPTALPPAAVLFLGA